MKGAGTPRRAFSGLHGSVRLSSTADHCLLEVISFPSAQRGHTNTRRKTMTIASLAPMNLAGDTWWDHHQLLFVPAQGADFQELVSMSNPCTDWADFPAYFCL